MSRYTIAERRLVWYYRVNKLEKHLEKLEIRF